MRSIREWQREVYLLAEKKGWHPPHVDHQARIPERLCLVHSEVSEALEAFREGHIATHYPHVTAHGQGKPEGLASELADVVIRVMDMCEPLGIDLEWEIERKHAFNKTRSHRHGGKKA